MHPLLAAIPIIAPAALAAAAAVAATQPGASPTRVLTATRVASVFALVTAVATAIFCAIVGPIDSPRLGVGEWAVGLRLDALSTTMFALVAFLGAIVIQYSRQYLDGDARHGMFLGQLSLTVAAVMLLVLAGTLLQLVTMWIVTSVALHRLLLFYPERIGAVMAARKKFIVARLGDAALIGAALLVARAFGTGDIALLLQRASELHNNGAAIPAQLHAAAALIALAAALKSAQFPTHGWLIEVMETPTPVSALLHAGILNGGIFLVARLAAVVSLSSPTLYSMIIVGGTTAMLASFFMITQSSVKTSLGYSSAAHMGFMLMLCGLGAYPVAILHLVAHSCYKAHAFLASGSIVEVARASRVPRIVDATSVRRIIGSMLVAIATVVGIGTLLGAPITVRPVTFGLSTLLAITLTPLLVHGLVAPTRLAVFRHSFTAAALVTLAFFALEAGATHVLANAVRASTATDTVSIALMIAVIIAGAAIVLFQLLLPLIASSPRWAAFYVHVRNGFYANARFDALVGAFRLTSQPVPTSEIRS